ncbi:MAG TPA: hypothetical protein VLA34_08670, partial [Candidatus Krumholzibacterium sp.]|nr:hypothetical protein [Candidatus Krumholzibacterium sp.]
GFPLKKDDQFCDFCQTPVGGEPGKIRRVPVIDGKSAVPPARLLFYMLVLFAAVIITFVIKS